MKYAKILGLAAMVLAALMAMAGTASATYLTSPAGTTYTGTIVAENEGEVKLTSAIGFFGSISCKKSTVEGKVETHGVTETTEGKLTKLTFTECTGGEPTDPVAKPGSLVIHTEFDPATGKEKTTANGNGTLTSKEAEVIVHNTSLGTCVFTTSNTGTDIGLVTGGTPAKLTISAQIPSVNNKCGTSKWEGTYKVVTPSTLIVD